MRRREFVWLLRRTVLLFVLFACLYPLYHIHSWIHLDIYTDPPPGIFEYCDTVVIPPPSISVSPPLLLCRGCHDVPVRHQTICDACVDLPPPDEPPPPPPQPPSPRAIEAMRNHTVQTYLETGWLLPCQSYRSACHEPLKALMITVLTTESITIHPVTLLCLLAALTALLAALLLLGRVYVFIGEGAVQRKREREQRRRDALDAGIRGEVAPQQLLGANNEEKEM
jgi:hypothetical protein